MTTPLADAPDVALARPADVAATTTQRAVLIASGPDRPGLVDEISSFLLARGANIADSRLINLHGSFATLLLIRGSDSTLARVRQDLPRLAGESRIQLDLQPADGQRHTPSFAYRFTATGHDEAGVLQRISHLLRALNINIDDVEARVPEDGSKASFSLELALSVPREIPISMLRDYLGHLCGQIGITWHLETKD